MDSAFSQVWYYMVLIQALLGMVMIVVGRLSNKEWQNPVPCIEDPEELSNQFSFANSVWLIIGSVMQQGSEIAPMYVEKSYKSNRKLQKTILSKFGNESSQRHSVLKSIAWLDNLRYFKWLFLLCFF